MEKAIRYIGTEAADTRFHDGALRPVIGARHIQIMRANREKPEQSQGTDWTYNHAPMLCFWNNRFYLLYLSSPVHEHDGVARVLLTTSPGGYQWAKPELIFEDIPVPAGVYRGKKAEELKPDARTIAHHRMGFYVAPNGVLLAMTHLGVTPDIHVIPNSGYGMGRIVRRVFADGTLGAVHVLRINTQAGWRAEHFPYPVWEQAEDAELTQACAALLKDTLATGAWWEEERLDKDFFPLPGMRAPSFCPLVDGAIAAIGKVGVAALSNDGGASWTQPQKAEGIISSGGKCWMQQTAQGRYAILYNPSPDGQHRWPLAVITSEDGYTYGHMLAAGTEVAPMRYGGYLKNNGINYIRGIMPGNGTPPDGGLWAAYSMNKEDIWVVRLPAEIRGEETDPVQDDFSAMEGAFPQAWHIYSPLWASVRREDGCLVLRDSDPCDYAKAMRAFPQAKQCTVTLSLRADSTANGELHMEAEDSKGMPAARVMLRADGQVWVRAGDGEWPLAAYRPGEPLTVAMRIDCAEQAVYITLNDNPCKPYPLMCPTLTVERLTLRTGPARLSPSAEDNLKRICSPDIPDSGTRLPEAIFRISKVTVR